VTDMKKTLAMAVAVLVTAGTGAFPAQAGIGNFLRQVFGVAPSYQIGRPAFSEFEAQRAVREALEQAARDAGLQLGTFDAFWGNSQLRIPLPDPLDDIQNNLSRVGLSAPLDHLQRQMNHAAASSIPVAVRLVQEDLRQIRIEDAITIVRGPDDSATRFLRNRTEAAFRERMDSVINESLARSGAWATLEQLSADRQFGNIAQSAEARILEAVKQRTVDAFYAALAREEALIRREPIKRSSGLLRKVFGNGY
jgi:hypothetical protein